VMKRERKVERRWMWVMNDDGCHKWEVLERNFRAIWNWKMEKMEKWKNGKASTQTTLLQL
jgi:hypothetical protein